MLLVDMAPSWSKSEIPVSAPSGSTRRFQILIAKLQLIERAICPDGPGEKSWGRTEPSKALLHKSPNRMKSSGNVVGLSFDLFFLLLNEGVENY